MKYLVFLFRIPALIVLYLSIHQEVREARNSAHRDKSGHEGKFSAPDLGSARYCGFGARCAQLEALMHSSGNINRSTGFPFTMCDSMISSTSCAVTRPYHTASG